MADKIVSKDIDYNERVTIRVPRDMANPSNTHLFVGVNDYTASIKRGVDVSVPRYVAEVVEESLSQEEKFADMVAAQSRE